MYRTGNTRTGSFVARSALGLALALGMATAATIVSSPAVAAKNKSAKISPSKGFIAAAAPAQKAIDAAAAEDPAAVAQAKSLLDQAFLAIESEDDRYMAGSLAVNLGNKAKDGALQRKGIQAMIASGLADETMLPKLYTAGGQLAYQEEDYADAQRLLKLAIDSGVNDPSAKAMLAEAYIATNQLDQGLAIFKSAIAQGRASGTLAPDSWYRRGLISAYKANKLNETADFGGMLIEDYPQPANVGAAVTILREAGQFSSQETLDLMRLMGRTNSYAEERDYVEYIQAADPRRLPGEVLEIIKAGMASGRLNASDTFVSDARNQASEREAADRASLAGYARDARAAGATVATVTGAADALLSYHDAAQAEELYKIAQTKSPKEPAEVTTRLGIAQVEQGKFAEARQTFAGVTGKRATIARLWSAYAAQKLAAAAPAAPAAAQ